jgi:hypothetical protein
MLDIFRKYYKAKVNKLYALLLEHKEDVILIRNFIKYHEDMLSGMDQGIIKSTGPLDAIFCFYNRDMNRTLKILEREDLTDKSRKEYEDLAFADYMVIKELSNDLKEVKPLYNMLYVNMTLLEKLNNKLPLEDRVDLNTLYNEGQKKALE